MKIAPTFVRLEYCIAVNTTEHTIFGTTKHFWSRGARWKHSPLKSLLNNTLRVSGLFIISLPKALLAQMPDCQLYKSSMMSLYMR